MSNLFGKASALQPADITNSKLTFLQTEYSITQVITNVINFVLFLAGAVAVFFLVYGGIQYITAGGDPDKASKGKTTVINAVIGIIIILAALLIVNWVDDFVKGGGTTS